MSEAKKKDLTFVHLAVIVVLMFFFKYLPAPAPITPYGMAIIGIFLGIIYGWSTSGLIWPSLLALVAVSLTEYGGFMQITVAALGNNNLYLLVIGMLAFDALNQADLSKYILFKLLSSKAVKGKPYLLLVALLMASCIVGFITGGVVVLLILWPIFTELFKMLGYEKGDKFVAMLLTGVAVVGNLPNCAMLPFYGFPILITGTLAASTGVMVQNAPWIINVFLIVVVFNLLWPLIMKVCGADFDKLKNADFTVYEKTLEGGLNKRQKLILGAAVLTLGIIVVLAFMPATSPLYALYNKVGVGGLLSTLLAFYLLFKVDNKPLLDIRVSAGNFYWDLFFLNAVAVFVSGLVTSEATGISAFFVMKLSPILGTMGPWMFILVVCAISLIATNFLNNMAVLMVMLNVVAIFYNSGMPFNIELLAVLLTTFAVSGIVTPAASIYGAMVHAHEYSTPTSTYTAGIIVSVFLFVIAVAITFPLSMFIY